MKMKSDEVSVRWENAVVAERAAEAALSSAHEARKHADRRAGKQLEHAVPVLEAERALLVARLERAMVADRYAPHVHAAEVESGNADAIACSLEQLSADVAQLADEAILHEAAALAARTALADRIALANAARTRLAASRRAADLPAPPAIPRPPAGLAGHRSSDPADERAAIQRGAAIFAGAGAGRTEDLEVLAGADGSRASALRRVHQLDGEIRDKQAKLTQIRRAEEAAAVERSERIAERARAERDRVARQNAERLALQEKWASELQERDELAAEYRAARGETRDGAVVA